MRLLAFAFPVLLLALAVACNGDDDDSNGDAGDAAGNAGAVASAPADAGASADDGEGSDFCEATSADDPFAGFAASGALDSDDLDAARVRLLRDDLDSWLATVPDEIKAEAEAVARGFRETFDLVEEHDYDSEAVLSDPRFSGLVDDDRVLVAALAIADFCVPSSE